MHESIHAVGHSSADVHRSVVEAFDATGGYRSAQLGPDAHQFVRVYRPTWALVLGVLLLPAFGLGILLFFVHRTESCAVTIVEGPTGAVVTISGRLLEEDATRVKLAVTGARVVQHASAAPPSTSMDSDPVPRPMVEVAMPPVPSVTDTGEHDADDTIAVPRVRPAPLHTSNVAPVALRFDDGAVVRVTTTVVVGRDPSPSMAENLHDARLVPIADPGVSKSHLRVRVDDAGAWLEDLASTNGTTIQTPQGDVISLVPGVPMPLTSGAVVKFGQRQLEVVDA